MDLEKTVCTIEQACLLVDHKIKLKTMYFWCQNPTSILGFKGKEYPKLITRFEAKYYHQKHFDLLPAPNTDELGLLLPKFVTHWHKTGKGRIKQEFWLSGSTQQADNRFAISYETVDDYLGSWTETTEAMVRMEAFLFLVHHGYVKGPFKI